MPDDFQSIMSNMGAPRGYHGQRRRGSGLGPILSGLVILAAIIIIVVAAF